MGRFNCQIIYGDGGTYHPCNWFKCNHLPVINIIESITLHVKLTSSTTKINSAFYSVLTRNRYFIDGYIVTRDSGVWFTHIEHIGSRWTCCTFNISFKVHLHRPFSIIAIARTKSQHRGDLLSWSDGPQTINLM